MHPLILNHRENMAYMSKGLGQPMSQTFATILEEIITKLLELHGDEIVPDESRVMTGPAGLTADGRPLTAKTRKYATRYQFDSTDTVDTVVAGIYEELAAEIKTMPEGVHFYPYQLVTSSGVVICPVTFNPVISFMIRYDVA